MRAKKYFYEYIGTQTPPERLRNKLSSVFTLLQLYGDSRAGEIDKTELSKIAEKDMKDIRLIITDIETDYEDNK